MTTTKKTNDGLFCPAAQGPCRGADCAWYNDDARGCVMAADSLQLILRTAITDAAVDIKLAFEEARHG